MTTPRPLQANSAWLSRFTKRDDNAPFNMPRRGTSKTLLNNTSPVLQENAPKAEPEPKRLKMTSSSSQCAAITSYFDKADSVTLIVGPEKHELLVHANYIARNSAFFETALKKERCEGQTRVISLPTDDYETMTTYLRFLYEGHLQDEFDIERLSCIHSPTADDCDKMQGAYISYAKLYTLGCRLMDNNFKNAAITKIFNKFTRCCLRVARDIMFNPEFPSISIIYNGTVEQDPARRLVVDMYIRHPHTALTSEWDFGFLLDLAQGLSDKVRTDEKAWITPPELCKYLS